MPQLPEEVAAIDQAAARINTEAAAIVDLAEKRRDDVRSGALLWARDGLFGREEPDAADERADEYERQEELAASAIVEAEMIRDASIRLQALVREIRGRAAVVA